MSLNKSLLLLLSVFIISFGSYIFENKYRTDKLNSKLLETHAVYIGLVGGVGNSKSYFKYTTNKNEILEVPIASKKKYNLGDTVWISYSVSDPTIAEIIIAPAP